MRMYKSLVPFCPVSFVSFLLYWLFFCFGFPWHCLSLYILEATQTHKLLWFCLGAYWICRLIWGELVQYYFFWCMFTYLSVQVFSSFLQLDFIVFSLGPYISFVRFILLLVLILLWTVQFSCSVMSNSLQPHGLQHARPPCPSPSPGTYSNSCPLSRWCCSTISSVIPFSSWLQSLPASGSFLVSQFFASSGQKYWNFSFSISPSNEYSGLISFTIDWFDLLAVQGTHKCLLQHHSSKASILWRSAFFIVPTLSPYMTTGKTIALSTQTFVGKVMSLLFNMLFGLIIAFLPRSKCLLISWLQSPSAVTLEPPKIKSVTVSIISRSVCHEVMGPDAMKGWDQMPWSLFSDFSVLSQRFHSPLSLSSRGSSVLHFQP